MTTDLQVEFRSYLREGHFLSGEEHLIPLTLALYRRLSIGLPVMQSALADDMNLPVNVVNTFISELPKSTMDTDRNSAIVAFGGLSLTPANHTFLIEDQTLHTWCVFDALFLPQLLGKSATCMTICPTTERQIKIELTPTAIASTDPSKPVMSIVAPDRDACCANLRGAFCDHVNFFADEDTFRQWAGNRTDVIGVSLDEAQELAHLRNHYTYGQHLSE